MLVTLAGWLGALFDSLLGATVQSIYYCPTCQKETERYPLHSCGTRDNPVARLEVAEQRPGQFCVWGVWSGSYDDCFPIHINT